MLGEKKEGEREGRALGGVNSKAGVGGWAHSLLALSIHTWGRVKNGGRESNSLQQYV